MNCTGLGARDLVGDARLEPQPATDYITLHRGNYMFPRSDGIVLGGTFEHGNSNLSIDLTQVTQIVGDHAAFFDAMRRS